MWFMWHWNHWTTLLRFSFENKFNNIRQKDGDKISNYIPISMQDTQRCNKTWKWKNSEDHDRPYAYKYINDAIRIFFEQTFESFEKKNNSCCLVFMLCLLHYYLSVCLVHFKPWRWQFIFISMGLTVPLFLFQYR